MNICIFCTNYYNSNVNSGNSPITIGLPTQVEDSSSANPPASPRWFHKWAGTLLIQLGAKAAIDGLPALLGALEALLGALPF